MKLLVEMAAGLAACGAAYYLARPDGAVSAPTAPPRATELVDPRSETVVTLPRPGPIDTPRLHAISTPDARPSGEQQRAMMTLRNEVIVAASADMQRRGQDVMACLEGVELAGVEKLRFSVHVTSSAHEATTGQWQFVEIADGEPLPPPFAACAARALGGGQHLVPPKGHAFPEYSGDLEILYTIPAPVVH